MQVLNVEDNTPQVIEVSSAKALKEAYATLSHGSGGTIKLTSDAEGLALQLEGGGLAHVEITAADPEDPVTISQIWLKSVENVSIQGLEVNSDGSTRRNWETDLRITNSENIEISDMTFSSFASGEYDPDDKSTGLAESLGNVYHTDNFVFTNNDVSNYYQGLGLMESRNITVSGNTFSEMQGDGIRMAGVQNVLVENNHFHDFLGTTQDFNHNDMIQLWSTNANQVSENVTITGNILDSGMGTGLQSIFLRNETFDRNVDTTHIIRDITITNNLIYNSSHHGIAVSTGFENVTVNDNTVLWNTAAGDAIPKISLRGASNVTAEGNISGGIRLPNGVEGTNNVDLNYTNPNSANYASRHLIDPFGGGGVSLDDLRLRADSPWAELGLGADASEAITQTQGQVAAIMLATADPEDPTRLTLDAGLSVGPEGFQTDPDYRFEWQLEDGTTLSGTKVTHDFTEVGEQDIRLVITYKGSVVGQTERQVDIADPLLLNLDFAETREDQSSYGSKVILDGAEWVNTGDGDGVRIGGSDHFEISRGSTQLHNSNGLAISIDLKLLNDDWGEFLRFGPGVKGTVHSNGSVSVQIVTDEGRYTVNSGDAVLTPGTEHNITVSYSKAAGTLSLLIDDVVVDEGSANGILNVKNSPALVFGTPWHKSVDAVITGAKVANALEDLAPQDGDQGDGKAKVIYTPETSENLLLHLDMQQGFNNLSDEKVPVHVKTAELTTEGEAPGVKIGGDAYFQASQRGGHFDDLDGFGLSIDLTRLNDDSGVFLQFGRQIKGTVHEDGTISVRMVNDAGRFTVDSGDVTVDVGTPTKIALGYGQETGQLVLMINDEIVGAMEVEGKLFDGWIPPLTFGTAWEKALDAVITNVVMTSDPCDFGLLCTDTLEESMDDDTFIMADTGSGGAVDPDMLTDLDISLGIPPAAPDMPGAAELDVELAENGGSGDGSSMEIEVSIGSDDTDML